MKEASGIPIFCAYDEVCDLTKLIPNPRNPNRHNDKQIALLAKIIRHQGWRNPIVTSNRSGFIVKGHGRLQAAQLLGVEMVPVDRQDYATEAEEHADMIADNRIAELAENDSQTLKDLLQELDSGEIDMDLTGFDEMELERLLTQFHQGNDAEPQIDKAAELQKKWQTGFGQLWQLGDHKILCGDATKAQDVNKLLGPEIANLMVTDPPYGVEYDPEWRNESTIDGRGVIGARAVGIVHNDDNCDWTPAWQLFPGNVAYVWHAGVRAAEVQASLECTKFKIRSQIIWAKNNFVISRGDYHWQHEPCWYAVREGKTGDFAGDRSQTTLWEIDKPQKSETGHSTQKPLECMEKPIKNNSQPGDLVYDPFVGSGTTIIACENLKRKCRAIEISPAYVAVSIQRWVDVTGKQPKLI